MSTLRDANEIAAAREKAEEVVDPGLSRARQVGRVAAAILAAAREARAKGLEEAARCYESFEGDDDDLKRWIATYGDLSVGDAIRALAAKAREGGT